MIEAPASKSFSTARALPRTIRISPLVWMNLVCLDAPLVAVSWHWLFARSFQIATPRGTTAALFLTAWLIYLADRFGDSLSLGETAPSLLRQRFCLQHRIGWMVAIALVALADFSVVATRLDFRAIAVGGGVGAAAFLYLLVNRIRPSLWRALPLKEISIGSIFAAGTMVGLWRSLTSAALPAWICFAALCSLNCICIAVWERPFDFAQQRISVATEFPFVERCVLPFAAVLCLTSLFLARSTVSFAIAASAILLAALHFCRARIDSDTRTALADLVLLTPLLVLSLR